MTFLLKLRYKQMTYMFIIVEGIIPLHVVLTLLLVNTIIFEIRIVETAIEPVTALYRFYGSTVLCR